MSQEADNAADCVPGEHGPAPAPQFSDANVARAARLFRALGDEARLRTLELLAQDELCVSEIADATAEDTSTVSHRLRLLHQEHLVARRRQGRHVMYRLADDHVIALVRNALEHVAHEP